MRVCVCVCVTLSNVCECVRMRFLSSHPFFPFPLPESNVRDETKNWMLFRITILDSIFPLAYYLTL